MHRSFYMFEKELIEHKMITRVPLFILLCGFLIFLSLLIPSLQGNFQYHAQFNGEFMGMEPDFGSGLNFFIVSGVGLISLVLTTLYLPKTLRKEREEGSSMFWWSMPVSHLMTLTMKLVFALLVIPAICSLLVLTADILLWVSNMISGNQLAPLLNPGSLFAVLLNWFSFLAKMMIVGLALLPLACVTLLVSQVVSSPVLVMVVVGYALKWLAVYLFGFYGISEFFNVILALPMKVLSAHPFSGFIDAGIINLVIYYLIGGGAFVMSLALSKTNETSIKGLFRMG